MQRTTDYAAAFQQGLSYTDFLESYGTPEQRQRWEGVHQLVRLSPSQRELLAGFHREIRVLCLAGAWCGDCVEQCPIFAHFEAAAPALHIRYVDRDADPQLKESLTICGGARVPQLVFLNEDGQFVSHRGDRTLAKYRRMGATQLGAACPTGLATDQELLDQVTQVWLDEFERVHWILRLSPRLREKHGD